MTWSMGNQGLHPLSSALLQPSPQIGMVKVERGGFSGSAPPTLGARCPQPSSAGLLGLRERVLTE